VARVRIVPGMRVNRLVLVELLQKPLARFQCDCGATVIRNRYHVRPGATTSCGCLNSEMASARRRIHGESGTPTWKIWAGMIRRCHHTKSNTYKFYGAKGITVCDRWRASFRAFKEDMGERPAGLTLDRIDGTKGYSPDNCRWATMVEQRANQKRNPKSVTLNGVTRTYKEWCSLLNKDYGTIYYRIRKGFTPVEAFTIPVRTPERKHASPGSTNRQREKT
jgi:hypothetical protein